MMSTRLSVIESVAGQTGEGRPRHHTGRHLVWCRAHDREGQVTYSIQSNTKQITDDKSISYESY